MPKLGLLSALLWGMYCIVSSESLKGVMTSDVNLPLVTSSLLVTSTYFVIGYFITLMNKPKTNIKTISKKDKRLMKFLALVISPVSIVAYLLSTIFIAESTSSVITSLYPIILLLITAISKRSITRSSTLQVLSAVLGSILLSNSSLSSSDSKLAIVGVFLALLSSLCYALESLIADSVDVEGEDLVYYKYKYSIVIHLLIVLALFRVSILHSIAWHILGATCMALSYNFFFKSIKQEGLLIATQSNISYPLFVIIINTFLGKGELFSVTEVVGTALIMIPVIISVRRSSQEV